MWHPHEHHQCPASIVWKKKNTIQHWHIFESCVYFTFQKLLKSSAGMSMWQYSLSQSMQLLWSMLAAVLLEQGEHRPVIHQHPPSSLLHGCWHRCRAMADPEEGGQEPCLGGGAAWICQPQEKSSIQGVQGDSFLLCSMAVSPDLMWAWTAQDCQTSSHSHTARVSV